MKSQLTLRSCDFLEWCGRNGLDSHAKIGTFLDLSPKTILRWKSEPQLILPLWVAYAVLATAFIQSKWGISKIRFPETNFDWFDSWRIKNSIDSYMKCSEVLGNTRQSVINWKNSGQIPSWVPIACLGYEVFLSLDVFPEDADFLRI